MNGDGIGDIIAGAPWDGYDPPYGIAGIAGIWLGETIDDIDQDGFLNEDDCEPHRPWAHPGAPEIPGNPADDDCDGFITCYTDGDGDGYGGPQTTTVSSSYDSCPAAGLFAAPLDCWDANPALGPQAVDLPEDDLDQDCDGRVVCLADMDGDGFGGPDPVAIPGTACSTAPPHDTDGLDCDDGRAETNPGAPEVPSNGHDDDCDGIIGCAPDADGDGYGMDDGVTWVPSSDTTCEHPGMSTSTDDCDDDDATIRPGVWDVAGDEIDEDCDGKVRCWEDRDRDGYGGDTVETWPSCFDHPDDDVVPGIPGGDCQDTADWIHPGGDEVPDDSLDEDCNGYIDCYSGDRDGDGYGGAGDSVSMDALPIGPGIDRCKIAFGIGDNDCGPDDPDIGPDSDVKVLGADHDCDGLISCARDSDLDGYGAPFPQYSFGALSCDRPDLSWTDDGDCDDQDPATYPGATDLVGDTVDQDCDGQRSCWADLDRDRWGSSDVVEVAAPTCRAPSVFAADQSGDCGPTDDDIHPDAREYPASGVDEDCDGLDTFSLTITPRPVIAGQPMLLDIRGARPGRTVWVARSTRGPGAGPCPPALAGGCLGLLQPVLAASRTADSVGRVTLTVAAAPGAPQWLQAWTIDASGAGMGSTVVAIP